MASPAASSVLLMLLVAFTAGANASDFSFVNQCPDLVWPAAIPGDFGVQLNPGENYTLYIPAGTRDATMWARTGCSFNGGGGSCRTGDCGGAFSCSLSPQPPVTLARLTLGGATDYYDISVIDGFNVAMQFSCSTGVTLNCGDASCPDAYHQPNDRKTHACNGNSNYQVTFCPA